MGGCHQQSTYGLVQRDTVARMVQRVDDCSLGTRVPWTRTAARPPDVLRGRWKELGGLSSESQGFNLIRREHGHAEEVLIRKAVVLKGAAGGDQVRTPCDGVNQIDHVHNEVAGGLRQNEEVLADTNNAPGAY